jgi:rod shape-determining protein MreB
LFSFLSSEIAIDLGTVNTLIYIKGKGVVLSEPSVVVVNKETGKLEAVGAEAKEMLGRTPGRIIAIRPLKDGVIADFDITEQMLSYFIRRAYRRGLWVRPRVAIAIPSGITQVEKRAVRDSALKAKASEVYLIEEPMAAAIGAGLPVDEPTGSLIVDIGGGTTEVAAISLGGIVSSTSIRVAGNEMDEAIINYVKKKYNLLIGEVTAERVKIEIGSAYPLGEERHLDIKGRDLVEGIPKTVNVSDGEIRAALSETVNTVVQAVKQTLEQTPPELAADFVDRGIILSGGGSLLTNIDKRLREETGVPVFYAEKPLETVVLGTGKLLDDPVLLKKVVAS